MILVFGELETIVCSVYRFRVIIISISISWIDLRLLVCSYARLLSNLRFCLTFFSRLFLAKHIAAVCNFAWLRGRESRTIDNINKRCFGLNQLKISIYLYFLINFYFDWSIVYAVRTLLLWKKRVQHSIGFVVYFSCYFLVS